MPVALVYSPISATDCRNFKIALGEIIVFLIFCSPEEWFLNILSLSSGRWQITCSHSLLEFLGNDLHWRKLKESFKKSQVIPAYQFWQLIKERKLQNKTKENIQNPSWGLGKLLSSERKHHQQRSGSMAQDRWAENLHCSALSNSYLRSGKQGARRQPMYTAKVEGWKLPWKLFPLSIYSTWI